MSVAVVTGSAGLIGAEAVRHFSRLGLHVVGIDNDMRARFFGAEASTAWNVTRLSADLGPAYTHHDVDVRDRDALFRRYGRDIAVVIHTAAQPSHDWAARDPFLDFDINAVGTLNILRNVREHCPDSAVIHCSTNKVYGDRPNSLPFLEQETSWEIAPTIPTRAASTKRCRSTPACTPSSARRRQSPTSSSRSTAATSDSGQHASAVDPHRTRPRRNRTPRLPGLRDALRTS